MYNLTNWMQPPPSCFSSFHSIDKLRRKIIIELSSLCPAMSHRIMETSQNDYSFLFFTFV